MPPENLRFPRFSKLNVAELSMTVTFCVAGEARESGVAGRSIIGALRTLSRSLKGSAKTKTAPRRRRFVLSMKVKAKRPANSCDGGEARLGPLIQRP